MIFNQSFMTNNLNKSLTASKFELCPLLRFIGCYFVLIWLVGTFLNGSLLYSLVRDSRLRRLSTNILIGGLLLADFIGAFVGIPFPTLTLLHCRRIFARSGCVSESMISYFAGCSNIYMLCWISIDRSIKSAPSSMRWTFMRISYAYLFSLVWTLAPVFGWSFYDYEGIGVSCSIKWNEKSWNVMSYNVAMFVFVFFAPIAILIVTNAKMFYLIHDQRRLAVRDLHLTNVRRRNFIQHRVLITIIFIIGGYFIAWTPYAILVFVRAFVSGDYEPSIIDTMPALVAKTSFAWNPLIFILRNGNFRRHIPFLAHLKHLKQRKIFICLLYNELNDAFLEKSQRRLQNSSS